MAKNCTQGRKRITLPMDDRYLRLSALGTRHCTARCLTMSFFLARNTQVSLQTVRNRVREDGIRARIPVKGPRLTREHRVARLAYALEHRNFWNMRQWSNVLFTDESRFCLNTSDRRVPVYRREGERYLQCNFRETENFGGGSVMVWGVIRYVL
jgi:hypothetical protein